jgi:hypothetical protein
MNKSSPEKKEIGKKNVFDTSTHNIYSNMKNYTVYENNVKYIKDILKYLIEYCDIIWHNSSSLDNSENIDMKNNMIKLRDNNILVSSILDKIKISNSFNISIETLLELVSSISILTYLINISINAIKLLNIHNMELLSKYNKIVLLNKKEDDSMLNIHADLFKKIIHNININQNDNTIQKKTIIELLSQLSNRVLNNILMYTTYTYIISNLIEHFEKNNMLYLIDLIISNVENLKNMIMNSDTHYDSIKSTKDFMVKSIDDIEVNIKLCVTNPFIKTFGLTASSKYDTLQNIILTVFKTPPKKKVKKETDLTQIAKELNQVYCFILIDKSIVSPIEFDIWKLYNKKESQYFQQDKNSGVNKLFIDKFNTIKFVDKNKKWNNDIKTYGDFSDNSEKFIIIEKLNDVKYRILKKYNPNQLLNKKSNSFIDRMECEADTNFINTKYNISGLLYFMNNNKILKTSDRINQHNITIEKSILKNMFLEHSIDVGEIAINAKILDINLLKYNLSNEINGEISKLLKTKYKKIQKKKDIIDLLHEDCIISVFSQFLITQYLTCIRDRFKEYKNASKLYYTNDILKTFMSQLLILKISMKKKIHDEFLNKEDLLEEILINNNNDKESNMASDKLVSKSINYNDIKQFFDDLFISIIDLLITDNDNIYLSLIYKTKLLELSLY